MDRKFSQLNCSNLYPCTIALGPFWKAQGTVITLWIQQHALSCCLLCALEDSGSNALETAYLTVYSFFGGKLKWKMSQSASKWWGLRCTTLPCEKSSACSTLFFRANHCSTVVWIDMIENKVFCIVYWNCTGKGCPVQLNASGVNP